MLLLAAILLRGRVRSRTARCSAMADGRVVRYAFPGRDRMAPVIAFEAEGETYLCQKQFNGYKVTRTPLPKKAEAWEDERGYLHIARGPGANLKGLAQQLWPLESRLRVYYDPRNPRVNYAGRPFASSFLVTMFFVFGASLIVLSGPLYLLIAQAA